ncbi:MAG: YiiD C-terminal domain-containing protein [Leptospiraceae bacterium]|nr:YiiD C-terminal domain-containing protein [Leptospiraceae bacterium]
MSRLDYSVYPLWKFLTDTYGFENAFAMFGPYNGAGIRIRQIDAFTVESYMSLTPTNTNYVGTHFGGSLYSMCDPFFMFILLHHFSESCMVWDKGAKIDFVRPGTGTVTARFHIPEEEIQTIREILKTEKKVIRTYTVNVLDETNNVVAALEKDLYIRRLPGK